MFKLMDKNIMAILHKLFLLNWPYDFEMFFLEMTYCKYSKILNTHCQLEKKQTNRAYQTASEEAI